MLIFAFHVKIDRKLTVANKITRNLFLKQSKSVNYQISKEKKILYKQKYNEISLKLCIGASRNYSLTNLTYLDAFIH